VTDFARALGADDVARRLAGAVERRYLSGASDSANTTDRIVAEGLAEGIFDLAVSYTSDVVTDPQAAVADGLHARRGRAGDAQTRCALAAGDVHR
jgi:hypothetical protein